MIGILIIIGGVWVFQDSLASILFYLGKENWHYSQALRIIRMLIGIVILVCGIILVSSQETI